MVALRPARPLSERRHEHQQPPARGCRASTTSSWATATPTSRRTGSPHRPHVRRDLGGGPCRPRALRLPRRRRPRAADQGDRAGPASRATAPLPAVPGNRPVVLYAPTWENVARQHRPARRWSHGAAVLEALLARQDVRVLFAPAAPTGSRLPEYAGRRRGARPPRRRRGLRARRARAGADPRGARGRLVRGARRLARSSARRSGSTCPSPSRDPRARRGGDASSGSRPSPAGAVLERPPGGRVPRPRRRLGRRPARRGARGDAGAPRRGGAPGLSRGASRPR